LTDDLEFDGDFEDDIIASMLVDDAYLKSAIRIVEAHHFVSKERSWLVKVIVETWNAFHERPTARLITVRAAEDFPDEEKRKPHLVYALRIFKARSSAPKSALDLLKKFVATVNLQLALEASAKALEKGKLEEAEAALATVRRGTSLVKDYTHIKWIENFEERQAARKFEKDHPDEFTTIPTGIKQLDRVLAGGVRKGEVGLVLATTGRGKSVMLTNLGHAGASRGYGVVYFALEMPAKQIAMRQDARWSNFQYNQFKSYDFKPTELRELHHKHKKALKHFHNKFHIVSMPVKSADIRTVRGVLDDLKEDHGFIPDMILMDSGDHLKAVDKTLDSYRLQTAEVYWSLKQLAEEAGVVLWSSTHAGREWATESATAEATSESYDKARIADIVMSLNDPNAKKGKRRSVVVSMDDVDEDEEVRGFGVVPSTRLELFLAKYRDGQSKMKIELDGDFSRMLIKEIEGGVEA
jgi:replicative DNA helicase